MTMDELRSLVFSQGGRIFTITFRRRNDKRVDGMLVARAGDLRTMVCRLHVHKGVKGLRPDRPEEDSRVMCVTVYEMAGKRSGFKRVPLDGITAINGRPIEIQTQVFVEA